MIDTTALFLHVLAAAGIVGGGLAQVLAGARVRGAADAGSLVAWAGFVRQAGRLVAASAVVSLLTGGHLAGAVWTTDEVSGFSYPFVTLGVAGLVLLAPVGPMVGGARLRRVLARAGDGKAPLVPAVRAEARSAAIWGPVHSLVGVAVGLVALMVYKPGWAAGVVLLVASFLLGWASGAAVADRGGAGD